MNTFVQKAFDRYAGDEIAATLGPCIGVYGGVAKCLSLKAIKTTQPSRKPKYALRSRRVWAAGGGYVPMIVETYTEKRFFEWHEDETSVTLRNAGASYGGGSEVLVIETLVFDEVNITSKINRSDPRWGGAAIPCTAERKEQS